MTDYVPGWFGQWAYFSNHGSLANREVYIYRTEFHEWSHSPWFTHTTHGLFDVRGNRWEPQYWWGFPDHSGGGPYPGPRNTPDAAYRWYSDSCTTSTCSPTAGREGNKAESTLNLDAGAPHRTTVARLALAGATVYLNDRNNPIAERVAHSSSRPSATTWVKRATASVDTIYRDDGLGMKSLDVVLDPQTAQERTGPATNPKNDACPGTYTGRARSGLPRILPTTPIACPRVSTPSRCGPATVSARHLQREVADQGRSNRAAGPARAGDGALRGQRACVRRLDQR